MVKPDYTQLNAANIVAFIGDIFTRRGAESYLGEKVTMSQHMLQAAVLAEESGADDSLICAALLHDIGHYTNEFPDDAQEQNIDNSHEEAGAAVLAPFFPKVVTDAVLYHVAAKRYLCATDPSYKAQLSQASIHTLKLQGGPMSAAEVVEMRENPNLDSIIQVRLWDDKGKDPSQITPEFGHYAPLVQRVADRFQEQHQAVKES